MRHVPPSVQALVRLADPLLAVAIIPAALLMRLARWLGVQRLPWTKLTFEKIGVFPIRDHYYEPLFSSRHIRAPLDRERDLPGIAMQSDQQLALIRQFHYRDELLRLPLQKGPDDTFYYNNGFFESTSPSA